MINLITDEDKRYIYIEDFFSAQETRLYSSEKERLTEFLYSFTADELLYLTFGYCVRRWHQRHQFGQLWIQLFPKHKEKDWKNSIIFLPNRIVVIESDDVFEINTSNSRELTMIEASEFIKGKINDYRTVKSC